MSKVSKIDQIHLRAVMLCMSKMSKIKKEHTHTFMLITFLIINQFSICKKLIYTVFDGMVEKPSVSASQNFLRIENRLIIKKVYEHKMCVYVLFLIFDIFDIHSITALRCI